MALDFNTDLPSDLEATEGDRAHVDARGYVVVDGVTLNYAGGQEVGTTYVFSGEYGVLELDTFFRSWTYKLFDEAPGLYRAYDSNTPWTDTFYIQATDPKGAGTSDDVTDYHIVNINVIGDDDADPRVTKLDVSFGANTTVTEGDSTNDSTSGTVTVTNADKGDISFAGRVEMNGKILYTGKFGHLEVTAATGAWTYTLDSNMRALDDIDPGETGRETFFIEVTDTKDSTNPRDDVEEIHALVIEVAGATVHDAGARASYYHAESGIKFEALESGEAANSWILDVMILSGRPTGVSANTAPDGGFHVMPDSFVPAAIVRLFNQSPNTEGKATASIIESVPAPQGMRWDLIQWPTASSPGEFSGGTNKADKSVTEDATDDLAAGYLTVPTAAKANHKVSFSGGTAHANGVQYIIQGQYGVLTLDADGDWRYTLGGSQDQNDRVNELTQGQPVTETIPITVRIFDDKQDADPANDETVSTLTHNLRISITGANDEPVWNVSDRFIATVVDTSNDDNDDNNDTLVHAGEFSELVDDPDNNSLTFGASSPSEVAYATTSEPGFTHILELERGDLLYNSGTGAWRFEAYAEEINELGPAPDISETFTVTVTDGEAGSQPVGYEFAITYRGAAEAPELVADPWLGVAASTTSNENWLTLRTQHLSATDIDTDSDDLTYTISGISDTANLTIQLENKRGRLRELGNDGKFTHEDIEKGRVSLKAGLPQEKTSHDITFNLSLSDGASPSVDRTVTVKVAADLAQEFVNHHSLERGAKIREVEYTGSETVSVYDGAHTTTPSGAESQLFEYDNGYLEFKGTKETATESSYQLSLFAGTAPLQRIDVIVNRVKTPVPYDTLGDLTVYEGRTLLILDEKLDNLEEQNENKEIKFIDKPLEVIPGGLGRYGVERGTLTFQSDVGQAGTKTFKAWVEDDHGARAQVTVIISVKALPTLTAIAPLSYADTPAYDRFGDHEGQFVSSVIEGPFRVTHNNPETGAAVEAIVLHSDNAYHKYTHRIDTDYGSFYYQTFGVDHAFGAYSEGYWKFTPDEAAINELTSGTPKSLTFEVTAIEHNEGGENGESAPQTLTITITSENDTPEIAMGARPTWSSSNGVVLGKEHFQGLDPDIGSAVLTYTIGQITNGDISHSTDNFATSTVLTQGSTFTQAQLANGEVGLNSQGSGNFELTLSDGNSSTTATIYFAKQTEHAAQQTTPLASTVDRSTQTSSEFIKTGIGSTTITPGSMDDTVYAGFGADTINLSEGGKDEVWYRIGAKTVDEELRVVAFDGSDTITGFAPGDDRIVLAIGGESVGEANEITLRKFLTQMGSDYHVVLDMHYDGSGARSEWSSYTIRGLTLEFNQTTQLPYGMTSNFDLSVEFNGTGIAGSVFESDWLTAGASKESLSSKEILMADEAGRSSLQKILSLGVVPVYDRFVMTDSAEVSGYSRPGSIRPEELHGVENWVMFGGSGDDTVTLRGYIDQYEVVYRLTHSGYHITPSDGTDTVNGFTLGGDILTFVDTDGTKSTIQHLMGSVHEVKLHYNGTGYTAISFKFNSPDATKMTINFDVTQTPDTMKTKMGVNATEFEALFYGGSAPATSAEAKLNTNTGVRATDDATVEAIIAMFSHGGEGGHIQLDDTLPVELL